jgi:hypothetical protein
MASEFAEKVRSLSFIGGGRTRDTRIREGRAHPETGVPYKITETDAGRTIEHATKDDRVDVVVTPQSVVVTRADLKEAADGR